jgi:SNF2 family DNA or RNA helicase
VFTHKLVIENTIEDRLLKVQERKEALAKMTLGPAMSKAEVVQRRLEELMQLFDS